MYKQGDIVQCVNNEDPITNWKFHKNIPEVDKKYTIRKCYQWNNTWGVLLEEIKNDSLYIPLLLGKAEVGFGIWRFRKLSDGVIKEELEETLTFKV